MRLPERPCRAKVTVEAAREGRAKVRTEDTREARAKVRVEAVRKARFTVGKGVCIRDEVHRQWRKIVIMLRLLKSSTER